MAAGVKELSYNNSMSKIKYHEIVDDIYDRVHFRSQVTGSTDLENILARFLEDLEGDILDRHRDLNDDPEATWEDDGGTLV